MMRNNLASCSQVWLRLLSVVEHMCSKDKVGFIMGPGKGADLSLVLCTWGTPGSYPSPLIVSESTQHLFRCWWSIISDAGGCFSSCTVAWTYFSPVVIITCCVVNVPEQPENNNNVFSTEKGNRPPPRIALASLSRQC